MVMLDKLRNVNVVSNRYRVIVRLEAVLHLKPVMENDACAEQKNGDAAVDQVKQPAAMAPYRYTKVARNTNNIIT